MNKAYPMEKTRPEDIWKPGKMWTEPALPSCLTEHTDEFDSISFTALVFPL